MVGAHRPTAGTVDDVVTDPRESPRTRRVPALAWLAAAALASAGCGRPALSSGVPRDMLYTDVTIEDARRICEAEEAFVEAQLPAREQIELECTIDAINASAPSRDVGACQVDRRACIDSMPVVTVPRCETPLPPPRDCRVTVGDYEDCVGWLVLHDAQLHALADCGALEDESLYQSLLDVTSEPVPPACERARRDCPAYFTF